MINKSQVKLCECGCGQPAPISKTTNKKRGYKKGQPTRFLSGHNPPVTGSDHPNWTGGKVEVSCVQCGKKFYRKPSAIKRVNFSFCSKKCNGQYLSVHKSGENSPISGAKNANWDGGKIEVSCSHCGKPVYRHKARIQNAKHFFCDNECCHAWQAINWKGKDHPAYKGGTKEVACDQCGKMFKKKPNRIKKDDHNFCSRKCMGEWYSINLRGENSHSYKGGYAQINCVQCGKEVHRRPSMIEDGENYFCSRECASAWRTINLCGENNPNWKGGLTKFICDQCGKPFERKPSITKQYVTHFCSKECLSIWRMINWQGENSPAWRGGLNDQEYCITWSSKEFKKLIFERDKHRCQNPDCWHTTDRLARHHVDYNKENCEINNIITLCISCNTRANANRDWHKNYYQAIIDNRFDKGEQTMNINPITS